MRKIIDLTGQKFGRLTIIKQVNHNKHGHLCWLCQCDCGIKTVVRGNSLKSGNSKSCGCLIKENITKHGMCGTSIYNIWQYMLYRCKNKNHTNYKDYGGRGIAVCDRWLKFENFYADMGDRPEGLSIERINNSKGYFPGNCKWATQKEQINNTRRNIIIQYKGEKLNIKQWAEKIGMNYNTFWMRLRILNWPIERAMK